jgi:hypothetical protein
MKPIFALSLLTLLFFFTTGYAQNRKAFINTKGEIVLDDLWDDYDEINKTWKKGINFGKRKTGADAYEYVAFNYRGIKMYGFARKKLTIGGGYYSEDLASSDEPVALLADTSMKAIDFGGARFQDFGLVAEGMIPAKKGGKWGYIDFTGKELIPFNYKTAGIFTNGFANVKKEDKNYVIDKNGVELFKSKHKAFSLGKHGYFRMTDEENDSDGLCDSKGKVLSDYKYKFIGVWDDENYYARTEKKDYVLLNSKLEEIRVLPYKHIRKTKGCNLFTVNADGLWGIIDNKETVIIKPQYKNMGHPYTDRPIKAQNMEGVYGYINLKNETVIPFQYMEVEDFDDCGVTYVELNTPEYSRLENIDSNSVKACEALLKQEYSKIPALTESVTKAGKKFSLSNNYNEYTNVKDELDKLRHCYTELKFKLDLCNIPQNQKSPLIVLFNDHLKNLDDYEQALSDALATPSKKNNLSVVLKAIGTTLLGY